MANGDVDVFHGDEMKYDPNKREKEENMHQLFPTMIGPDHYDPNNPEPGRECISRRCYGWSVPVNKRVFIEGDVRVDLFVKSEIKVLGVVSSFWKALNKLIYLATRK